MADIRCPNCGKDNPDFLDRCQFCQSPLKPGASLRAGENPPTKKQTGELEPVLPDWLKELRQQGRQSADDAAAQEVAQPKAQKNEPTDFLAGLASQAGTDDNEIPDWLASIHPEARAKPFGSSSRESDTSIAAEHQPSQDEEHPEIQEERDELSEWFSQASEGRSEPFILEPGISLDDPDWISNLDSAARALGEPVPPKEEEDLSWLHNLEASAKPPAKPPTPRQDSDWKPPSQPSPEAEDLSWLNNLGGISEAAQPIEETPLHPSSEARSSQEDLGWLENLGKVEPIKTPQPSAPEADLSWLDHLDDAPEAAGLGPAKPAPQEDLDWLSTLGQTSEPAHDQSQQHSSQKDREQQPGIPDSSQFVISPRRTAPLGEEPERENEPMPDWLKSATEEPSMPPLGAGALEWFASRDLDKAQPTGKSESAAAEPSAPGKESQPISNQDIDALFSIDVPDWLSKPEAGPSEASLEEAKLPSTEREQSLAPVELPSWVQAMKPVEAVISESAPGTEDQALETDGPLAGLRGVIPLMPIGSSRRPKALSLTLQTTDEQQTGAALLEEILTSETAPRPLVTASAVTSQNMVRWLLAVIVLVVLGAMIGLGSRSMPISTALPAEVGAVSNAVGMIPEGAPVLVVLDYEPARASEMEAISSPLLNSITSLRDPDLSFLSTTLNGSALAERLMINAKITTDSKQYLNLGYLPGGSAGVLAFLESPQTAIPSANVQSFSQYGAVIVLTDHAESGRMWVEQLDARKQSDPALASQPLLIVASAQTGPLFQPYVASHQVTGIINGLSDAARYELANNTPPGIARTYWDAFGIGLLLAIILITFGSLWSIFTGMRASRSGVEQS